MRPARGTVAPLRAGRGGVGAVVAGGLAVRLLLAPFTSWPQDVATWFQTAAAGQHTIDIYARVQFPYPPLWGQLLAGLGQLLQHLGVPVSALAATDARLGLVGTVTQSYSDVATSPAFNLAFKSILFLFDLGTALLVLRLVTAVTGSARRGRLAMALWFLNPLVVFESAVHGAFDTMVAFLCLASLVLLLQRRHLWCGVAIGAGVATKLAPGLLLPLLVLVAAARPGGGRLDPRAAATVVGGAAVGLGVVVLPEVVAGWLPTLLHGTFARTQTVATTGGIGLFGLRDLRALAAPAGWVSDHGGVVTALTGAATAAAAVGLAVLAARRAAADRVEAVMAGAAAVLAVTVLLQPLAQPQYALWLLPELAVLVAVRRRGARPLLALTVAPLAFVLALLGPVALLAPAAVWTGWPSPGWVADLTIRWFRTPALLWGDSASGDIRAAAAVIAIAGLVGAGTLLLRHPHAREAATADETAAPGRRSPLATAMVAVLLLASPLAVAAVDRPPPLPHRTASLTVVSARRDAAGLQLQLLVAAGAGQERLRLVAVPLGVVAPARAVRVFLDARYPLAATDRRTVQGVYDHLGAELSVRGDHRPVSAVDGPGLVALLTDLAGARRTLLVMTTGTLPADVLSLRADLLTPWLHAGGELVWGGDAVGYYSVEPDHPLDPRNPEGFGPIGPALVLGPGTVRTGQRTGRAAGTVTPVAAALGLRYRLTGAGVRSDTSGAAAVRPLGYVGGGYSSLTWVTVGRGGVLDFGGEVYDELTVAHDIALLLLTHVLDAVGPPRVLDLPVPGLPRREVPVTWNLPDVGSGPVLLALLDPGLEGVAFAGTVLPG